MCSRREIKEELMKLIRERGADKSICPSEVARSLRETNWRALMDTIRDVTADLQTKDRVRVTQGNRRNVDPRHAEGPIRIHLKEETQ
jgi:hypothetical protein